MTADIGALAAAFRGEFGRPAELLSEAPGRVNLIGEHTDYNEGYVLPMAIDRTVAVAAARRPDPLVRVSSLDLGERDEFPAGAPRRTGRREWRDYVRGVAWALADAGSPLPGVDLAITGDVPSGAGLSSSAALEVATAGAFAGVAGVRLEPTRLALLARLAENSFVGVECGIMDQLAGAMARAGHALLIDCRSLETDFVPLPASLRIVVVHSGVPRKLAETPYNERRRECAEAARELGVASLREADLSQLAAQAGRMPETIMRRARHVVTENQRVRAAATALREGELDALGRLMYESHESLRDDFQASVPELDLLVELAREAEGVCGARLTGAGFGGSTVNLVRAECLPGFETDVVERYRERTGLPTAVHACRAVDGLRVSNV